MDLDGPVHYRDYGGPSEGPLVVCVHGLGGCHASWSALAPLLARDCRMVAPDLVGFGRTPTVGRSTSVRANQRLVDRFLTQLSDEPAVLVGNSMGGMIAAMQATERPGSVRGLVLVDPVLPALRGVRQDPVVAATFALYAAPVIGRVMLSVRRRCVNPARAARDSFRFSCSDHRRVPAEVIDEHVRIAVDQPDTEESDRGFLAASRSLLRVMLRSTRYVGTLRSVRAPVLLLHGARDRFVPLSAATAVARAIPRWQFAVAPDTGHLPHLESPRWTADMIKEWFAGPGLISFGLSEGI
jgi:pimeloyl-ACP methyl ester carboxylesterase